MAIITPNLKLQLLEYGQTDYATVLNSNFNKISLHDHSRGKILTVDFLKINSDISFAKKFVYEDFSIRSCKYISFYENDDEVEQRSFYMQEGDYYYRDGYSREIQITNKKGFVLNAFGYGFISGDMNEFNAKIEYSTVGGYHFYSNNGDDFATVEFNNLVCLYLNVTDMDAQNLYVKALKFTNLSGVPAGQQVLLAVTSNPQFLLQTLDFPSTVPTILSKITNYSTLPQSTFQTNKTLGLFANKLKTRSTSGANLTTYHCDTRLILKNLSGKIVIIQQKLTGRGIDEFCFSNSYSRGLKEMCPISNSQGNYFLNSAENLNINLLCALNVVK